MTVTPVVRNEIEIQIENILRPLSSAIRHSHLFFLRTSQVFPFFLFLRHYILYIAEFLYFCQRINDTIFTGLTPKRSSNCPGRRALPAGRAPIGYYRYSDILLHIV